VSDIGLRELVARWEQRVGAAWTRNAVSYRDFARDALAFGHPILAYEAIREALAVLRPDAELRYLAALASARIGGWREAEALVAPLLEDASVPHLTALEARSLAGRIAKDRWSRTAPGPLRDALGSEALTHYRKAWNETGDPFPGINAATLALLTGDPKEAWALARTVRARVDDSRVQMEPHWREATLGEAAVIVEDYEEARRRYAAAVEAAGRHVGHVAAMRRQLRLIARYRPVPEAVLEALAQPMVVAFIAPTIDPLEPRTLTVPPSLEPQLAAAIEEAVEELGVGFGYSSAACGADLLFVEALLARGAEVHVTLPFERDDFVKTSVAVGGLGWVERFDRALSRATTVTYAVRERFLGDDALFGYAETLTSGASMLRAHQLETEPIMLAVIDDGVGVTAPEGHASLKAWRRCGLDVEVIRLRAAAQAGPPSGVLPKGPVVELRAGGLRRRVKTMLFADVVGFSKLHEEETPVFLVEFLGSVAEILAVGTVRPEFVNTWGDGLFMVFDDVAVGADAALRLRDAVLRTDWPARGLPPETSIRVGMHAGPVFPADDPLIGRANFFGSHVNRAARIEPVAAPGAIYVSESMACLLAASGGNAFATDYLGSVTLAKGFDTTSLYRLRRADEAE
jgi:class 3 adenylate cyclase